MPKRKDETQTGFTLRMLRNETIEACASWIEYHAATLPPVKLANALRQELKDE